MIERYQPRNASDDGHRSGLVRYDAACRAVADALKVDDVVDIRSKAEAARAYARQARNRDLEIDAAEIRLRAERRLGELLRETERHPGGRPKTGAETELVSPPRLAELGIDKRLSARAQRFAAVAAQRFEAGVARWREKSADSERVTMDLANVINHDDHDQEAGHRSQGIPTADSGASSHKPTLAHIRRIVSAATRLLHSIVEWHTAGRLSAAEQQEAAAVLRKLAARIAAVADRIEAVDIGERDDDGGDRHQPDDEPASDEHTRRKERVFN